MPYADLIEKAHGLHQAGRLPEAQRLYQQILQKLPGDYTALCLMGLLYQQLGQYQNSIRALELALAVRPDSQEALQLCAAALISMRRFDEATLLLDRIVEISPNRPEIWNIRGAAKMEAGQSAAAMADFDRALSLNKDFQEVRNNRGLLYHSLGQFTQAADEFTEALALRPDYVEALINRGVSYLQVHRIPDAIDDLRSAVRLAPDNVRALTNFGAALASANLIDEAISAYDAALAADPRSLSALKNRIELLWKRKGRIAEAIKDIDTLLREEPDAPYFLGDFLHLKMQVGDWLDHEELKQKIVHGVLAGKRVVQPFMFQTICDSPPILARCAKIFSADRYPAISSVGLKARPPGKIRIGYVSGELRQQATAILAAGLFEQHDRDRFAVIGFDNGFDDGSLLRARLMGSFDEMIPIAHLTDDEAAHFVTERKIDILVNLNGHFGLGRTGIFARRPAPVQVNYLGFPGTMGAPYMDYILADACVIPPGEAPFYDEKIVWLPDSYQINDNKRYRPDGNFPSRTDHALPGNAFVFCNFNYGHKIAPGMFDAWMRILRSVPSSVLWLLSDNQLHRDNLGLAAEQRGVDRRRLVFAATLPPDRHLERLPLADLVLDTLPYNAHTTASDALWVGVPFLTLLGNSFPGRVGASLLTAVGLPKLIAESLDDYEGLARELASDPGLLLSLRRQLTEGARGAPLFDTRRTTRSIERAFAKMVDIWRRGENPRSFTVKP